jgi:hypothetical protein
MSATPEKPNVEIEDPAKKPSLEDLGSGPAERAMFGRSPGTAVFRVVLGLALFILVFGTLFYALNR